VQNAFREVPRTPLVAQLKGARSASDAERDRAAALTIALAVRAPALRERAEQASSKCFDAGAEPARRRAEPGSTRCAPTRAAIADLFKALGGVWS